MASQHELEVHRQWIGYAQPVGLVASPHALCAAQAFPDAGRVVELQRTLVRLVHGRLDDDEDNDADDERAGASSRSSRRGAGDDDSPLLEDFPAFTQRILDWEPGDLAGGPDGPAIPSRLEAALPDYGETLRPNYAALNAGGDGGDDEALLLVQVLAPGTSLDAVPDDVASGWPASPQSKLERLLRETKVPAGVLCNAEAIRLVYAPKGETSGHVTFPIKALCEVSGRSLLAALHMLLSANRVFNAPERQSLLEILSESRKYQNEVSTKLADQVLGALWELLRGFQAADEVADGRVLHGLAREEPEQIYGGLLTVLLRLVFLLYSEERGLMPGDDVYTKHYAIGGLHERLREDAGRYPDTMDQRYGAWAGLLSLFRLVYDGGGHGGEFHLPTRHGKLFDPDEYPFLEGRAPADMRRDVALEAPRVSDGCIFRVLEALLVLDGERLSYRALDVEQIGSVYEAMMGFAVETTGGRAIAVRPHDVVVNVDDDLLERKPADRVKFLATEAGCKLAAKAATELKKASTPEEVVAALGRRVSKRTPALLPPGALFLQPGEERRRTGSHYTPRELTGPIVETTLRPVLEGLGERPTPEQILGLKVCDPAMGSGAFLVEACRQLAQALVHAWDLHDATPTDIPPDEDPELFARRLVAQRCLYGVDKNRFAVDLAKLSLWLVTLAKDHAFTFLDHALKCGDSLVGLTCEQLGRFHWDADETLDELGPLFAHIKRAADEARALRERLAQIADEDEPAKREALGAAERELENARLVGDLVIAAFFGEGSAKKREERRRALESEVGRWRRTGEGEGELREAATSLRDELSPILRPFHWEIEFPEVFGRRTSGFDAMVGNPPFLGGNKVWATLGGPYRDFLTTIHTASGGRAVDLVVHFFRRCWGLTRDGGTLGLIATNTVAQGDTRSAGLAHILTHGGHCYSATRRLPWPGSAAVTVSVIHILRGDHYPSTLDGRAVPGINSHLVALAHEVEPTRLADNREIAFAGSHIYGVGFLFADNEEKCTPLSKLDEIRRADPRTSELVGKYVGGEDINSHPTQDSTRWVINFGSRSLEEARKSPRLLAIVEDKVRPEREKLGGYSVARSRAKRWWQFGTHASSLEKRLQNLSICTVTSSVSARFCLARMSTKCVFAHTVVVFASDRYALLAILQSRLHELWARFFASTLEDRIRYSPADCFETLALPRSWATDDSLESIAAAYDRHRAALMIENDEGLTTTYNRFHDPDESDSGILRLRELHEAMDRAVLDAYGWAEEIPTACDFFLDYEIDEETWSPRKRKPYRYRWPDEVHDEVLGRLLELNRQRAEEEAQAGRSASKRSGKKKRTRKAAPRKKKARKPPDETNRETGLFDEA